jgi:hypothetical protein
VKGVPTLLSHIVEQLLGAAAYNADDVAAPAAVLWPDRSGEWEPLLPTLRDALPQLFTLGDYAPETRCGPGIWLKCAIAGTLDGVGAPTGTLPVVYLPGVGLKDLRAVEECPRALQPLAELQYRGRVWAHTNGRDWTLLAVLTADDALGLDVARDSATADAMRRALRRLARVPVSELRGRHLDSYDFDEMLTDGDSVLDVLRWIEAPTSIDAKTDPNGWAAFRNICKKEYGFDPAQDGRLGAAERMGMREGKWRKVWERFTEAPANWPGMPEALRQARPQANSELFGGDARGTWPQDNEQDELELRNALVKLEHMKPADAAQRIAALEAEHAGRRTWVWSTLGRAPLAAALRYLHDLASAVAKPVPGTTHDEMANAYGSGAWKADASVLLALNSVRQNGDAHAVGVAARALYLPWLSQASERLQAFVAKEPLPAHDSTHAPMAAPEPGTVLLFVDGLRFDVGEQLKQASLARRWNADSAWRWSALPSVTPTAKPAVSPIADLLSGGYAAQEFTPNVGTSGKALSSHSFKMLLSQNDIQFLASNEIGDPSGCAWTECGDLDSYGHSNQWKLSWRISEVLASLEGRVAELFAAGWKQIRVVTDHGWLLVPGGLPKTDLPGYVADSRWARCAVLKDGATPAVPLVPWYWDPHVQMAVAPGITSFIAGVEYAHGGVSLQECVIPVLEITTGTAAVRRVSIDAVKWVRLRCKVTLTGDVAGCNLDIRTQAAREESTITGGPKPIKSAGEMSLVVTRDDAEGIPALIVVLDEAGTPLAKLATIVGEG